MLYLYDAADARHKPGVNFRGRLTQKYFHDFMRLVIILSIKCFRFRSSCRDFDRELMLKVIAESSESSDLENLVIAVNTVLKLLSVFMEEILVLIEPEIEVAWCRWKFFMWCDLESLYVAFGTAVKSLSASDEKKYFMFTNTILWIRPGVDITQCRWRLLDLAFKTDMLYPSTCRRITSIWATVIQGFPDCVNRKPIGFYSKALSFCWRWIVNTLLKICNFCGVLQLFVSWPFREQNMSASTILLDFPEATKTRLSIPKHAISSQRHIAPWLNRRSRLSYWMFLSYCSLFIRNPKRPSGLVLKTHRWLLVQAGRLDCILNYLSADSGTLFP